MSNILIADDNRQITSILSEYAKKEGFTVYTARDGEDAIEQALSIRFDIILLDVTMPKKDGFETCREIRSKSNVPIIMITARGEDFDRIMGLNIGADDYIVKPFSPGEVMARVRAILRRIDYDQGNEKQQMLNVGSLSINLEIHEARIENIKVSLTRKEIELLFIMAEHPNKVFTRDNLLDSVWGYEYFGDSRTVDSHIKRLRSKIDEFDHPGWQIKTVWGLGYKFEAAADEV